MAARHGSGAPFVSPAPVDIADLYLDLLKRCLTFLIWDAKDGSLVEPRGRWFVPRLVQHAYWRLTGAQQSVRREGRDWPKLAHTMVGLERLDHLHTCVETVLAENVPGDLLEAGVWRGGAAILMRAVLKVRAVHDRTVWLADSFEGLPKPDPSRYPEDRGFDLSGFRSLAVSLEDVQANFAAYRLLDDQVRFLKGWFKDTLPGAPVQRLALLRLDGDLFESTMDTLEHLYPRLSPGGFVIVDDYGCSPPCKSAVDTYRARHHLTEPVMRVDWSAVYWRKGGEVGGANSSSL